MAADNFLSVNLPPVQWASGTVPHEPETGYERHRKKNRKPESQVAKTESVAAEVQIEQAAPHEVDSFA